MEILEKQILSDGTLSIRTNESYLSGVGACKFCGYSGNVHIRYCECLKGKEVVYVSNLSGYRAKEETQMTTEKKELTTQEKLTIDGLRFRGKGEDEIKIILSTSRKHGWSIADVAASLDEAGELLKEYPAKK